MPLACQKRIGLDKFGIDWLSDGSHCCQASNELSLSLVASFFLDSCKMWTHARMPLLSAHSIPKYSISCVASPVRHRKQPGFLHTTPRSKWSLRYLAIRELETNGLLIIVWAMVYRSKHLLIATCMWSTYNSNEWASTTPFSPILQQAAKHNALCTSQAKNKKCRGKREREGGNDEENRLGWKRWTTALLSSLAG